MGDALDRDLRCPECGEWKSYDNEDKTPYCARCGWRTKGLRQLDLFRKDLSNG